MFAIPIRERLPSAAAALAVQAGLLALLVLSFEVVRRVAPEKETIINLPPLVRREAQRAPVVIDARRPPEPGGGAIAPTPPLSLPAYATPSFSLGVPAGETALQALNRAVIGCGPGTPRDPRIAAPCPSLTGVARTDPNQIPLTGKPVPNAPVWQAEVDRRGAPMTVPGGDPLGILLTLLGSPESFLDRRNYSYTPQAPVSGADHLHDMITNNPLCLSGAGASAAEQCMRDAGAVTMHSIVALGVPPPSGPHVSDTAFQQALAATQARTRALYGKPAAPANAGPAP
jgi:hypothetical protein